MPECRPSARQFVRFVKTCQPMRDEMNERQAHLEAARRHVDAAAKHLTAAGEHAQGNYIEAEDRSREARTLSKNADSKSGEALLLSIKSNKKMFLL